jgi:hypothetical protein
MELLGQIALSIVVMFFALWAWSWGARFASGVLRGIGQAIGNMFFGWLPRKAIEGLTVVCVVPALFANYSGFALIPLAFVAFFGGWFGWGWAEPANFWAWRLVAFMLAVELTSGVAQGAIYGRARREGASHDEAALALQ